MGRGVVGDLNRGADPAGVRESTATFREELRLSSTALSVLQRNPRHLLESSSGRAGEDRRRAATSSPFVFLGGRRTGGFRYNGGSDAGTSSRTTGTSNPLFWEICYEAVQELDWHTMLSSLGKQLRTQDNTSRAEFNRRCYRRREELYHPSMEGRADRHVLV